MKKISIVILIMAIFFRLIPAHASSEYSYQWISQSSYPTLKPGETTQLWVQIKNTGTAVWDKNIPIRLGTDRNIDRHSDFFMSDHWLSPNRSAYLTPETNVAPGEKVIFLFNIIAPNTPGTYLEYFRPVVENVSWLEDYGIFWQINVTSEESQSTSSNHNSPTSEPMGTYRSILINQDSPKFTIIQGETKNLTIEIKNDGTAIWYNTGDYPIRLATSRDWDRSSLFSTSNWISTNRAAKINNDNVIPGQNTTYQLQLTAPTNIVPGVYHESFQSVAENITWFMDYDINYEITVKNKDAHYGEIVSDNDIDTFLGSDDEIIITDLSTGNSMKVKTIGMDRYHADVVPLTIGDTQLIRDIWNFDKEFTPWCPGDDWILWKPNAVTVEISSDPLHRRIAGAMIGCPHDVDGGITDNGFPGHLCLHFHESIMHGKSTPDCSFQKMVQKAAGNPNYSTYGQIEPCWNPCISGDC